MNIGFVGLGKLGLPCALAIASKGHRVCGYDVDEKVGEYIKEKHIPYHEEGVPKLLKTETVDFVPLEEVIERSEMVFVSVQTPHEELYEGITRLPDERVDFDYRFLKHAMMEISDIASVKEKEITVVIISTVLPGTIARHIYPVINDKYIDLLYNPFFIAMGTTVRDFLNPDIVLIGDHYIRTEDGIEKNILIDFYKTIIRGPVLYKVMSVQSAELTKVAYNTIITSKINIANTIMEICHKIPFADVDEVTDALKDCHLRITSPRYMDGGMGDGGGCFPAGELVMTNNGMRPIESIELNDMVLTNDGSFQKVVKRWERDYNGDLVKIKNRGLPPVKMTTDHPVMACVDGRKKVPDGRRNTSSKIIDKMQMVQEIKASDLTCDHLIGWPYIQELQVQPYSNDFLYLAGWYLSEGSIELNKRRGRIRFDLHKDEIEDAKKIESWLLSCAVKKKNKRGDNAKITHEVIDKKRAVRFGNKGLAKKLVMFFGKGAADKKIPGDILFGNIEQFQYILHGLIRGDGCRSDKGVLYSTISKDLAYGVFIMLHRLQLYPTLREIPPRGIHKKAYEVRIRNRRQASKLCKIVDWEPYDYQKEIQVYADDGNAVWRHIQSIETIPYKGKVYNLWIDKNHTYVVNCGVVHNCHPRDNIALSWLARELNLSRDIYEDLMKTREAQTEWLAELIIEECRKTGLKPILLGYAFKPETNITTGSPARLLSNIMTEKEQPFAGEYDPFYQNFEFIKRVTSRTPAVYFIGTKHEVFKRLSFKEKSVVIDPFRYIPYKTPQESRIKYVYVGSEEGGTGIRDELYEKYNS